MENITKSIIYGNAYENRYGRFLPVCSSISDRGSTNQIQLQFSTSLTIFTTHPISKSTTVLATPIGQRKLQSFLLLRKKMSRTSTTRAAIVTRLWRAQGRNCFICCRNSVSLEIHRYKERLHRYIDPAIQSLIAFRNNQLSCNRIKLPTVA